MLIAGSSEELFVIHRADVDRNAGVPHVRRRFTRRLSIAASTRRRKPVLVERLGHEGHETA
jgi:hypothetical protein